MKKIFSIFLFIAFFFVAQAQRTKYNFNSDWKIRLQDDSTFANKTFMDDYWPHVTLPYAWNENDAFKKDIAELSTGIAWYRKHFNIPASAKGQKIFIEFEGIRQAGEFYLNGKFIGRHENGVMAFGFDISDDVLFADAENVLAVRTDNSWDYKEHATDSTFQWQDKNFNANYGGIIKNVYLHILPRIYQTLPLYSNLHTTGVYIYGTDYNIKTKTATIHAESEIKNESNTAQNIVYSVQVTDMNGKLVKTFIGDKATIAPGQTTIVKAAAPISGLNFWSWGYGYLYNVSTALLINNKIVDSVVTKTGFRKTAFKDGMVYLNDRVIMIHGYAQRSSNEWPAVGSSVPAWLSDYSNGLIAEGNGNLVRWMHITPWKQDIESLDRMGIMQSMPAGDAEAATTGARWQQRIALMKDAIIYNRNNPSIIFYECGNKGISDSSMAQMKALRNQYDPQGGRAIGSREMLGSKIAEYGGEMLYTNKSAHMPLWAMEYNRDEGARKYWDDYTPPYHKDGDGPLLKGQPAPQYNRNMESLAVENVQRWFEFWHERPGTGKRVSAGGANIIFSESNTHHRGAQNYRTSGEVDALRIKKENFYANQTMWDGWVNPEQHHLHIIGHWSYEKGVVKDIVVVSTAAKVELKVNGISQGFGTKSDGFLFTFKNITWQPGEISAQGFDEKNNPVCQDKISSTGPPVAIRLSAIKRPNSFIADGHDLQLVQAEVVDAKGNRCPAATDMINYTVEGPAAWRGGMAIGPDNYILAQSFPVEGGVNRFLIRSTTSPGMITITASATGLETATILLTTQPFVANHGLSTMLPSDGLVSNLQRGPTPSTPSYTITRTSINIINATAGANADSAFASYDDNETTAWVNDGQLATAWIAYELEKLATVSEVTLKLHNFNTHSYTIRITVDGKEVFNDSTKITLGYFTAQCKPTLGKKVRIELIKPSTSTNANDNTTFGIIEAEIY